MTKRETPIDWERIEAEYSANVLSIREIAAKHSVSDRAIRKRAEKGGWTRDLKKVIDVKVRTELVQAEVRRRTGTGTGTPTEEEVIAESVATQVTIVQSHRIGIAKAMLLTATLMEQLMLAVDNRDTFQVAIEELTSEDKTPQRYNALMRGVALPTHIVAAKDLALAMRTLMGLQRQAFGLAELEDPTPPDSSVAVTPTEEALAKFEERQALRLKKSDEEK